MFNINKQNFAVSMRLKQSENISSNYLDCLPVRTDQPYKERYNDGWLYCYLSYLLKLTKK